jgi:hypothetical protein
MACLQLGLANHTIFRENYPAEMVPLKIYYLYAEGKT